MAFGRKSEAQPFPHSYRGKPAAIPSYIELMNCFLHGRKGSQGSIEMYATATVGTEVWLRYGLQGEKAAWQCLAMVTGSQQIQPGTSGHPPKYRTSFVLMGDPELDNTIGFY